MPRVIRETLTTAREILITVGPFILLALVLLLGAFHVLKPTPPKRVVPSGGAEKK